MEIWNFKGLLVCLKSWSSGCMAFLIFAIFMNEMRITKLFSKLRLVKNWQSGREKREALSTENRDHFSLFPYNLHFLVKLGCMSYVTIICSSKFPIQWRFQILCTLKIDLSASLYVRPTFQGVAINPDIHSYICQVGNPIQKFQWPEYSDQYLELYAFKKKKKKYQELRKLDVIQSRNFKDLSCKGSI